ncbi:MFS transporter [Chloroflexota bacterium]
MHDSGIRERDRVVIAACFILTLSMGPLFFTLTTFFSAFEADFGWSRTLISSVQSITLVVAAGSNFAMGWVIDRYGTRRLLIVCSILMGLGLALSSQVHQFWQLIFLYGIAALGSGAVYIVPMVTVQRFFSEQKMGLALGLTSAGIAVSRLIFVPITGFLISTVEWQNTYIILGVATWILMIIPSGLLPSKASTKTVIHSIPINPAESYINTDTKGVIHNTNSLEKIPLRNILKSKTFFFTCMMFILPIMSNHMIGVHIVPFAEGQGISNTEAATAVGLLGAIGIAGTIIWPALSRRVSWNWLVSISGVMCSLTILWLVVTSSLWMLYLFVMIFGFFYAASNPTRMGLIRHIFGTRELASIMSIIIGIGTLFGALGPLLGGYVYDSTSSYTIALIIGAICWAVSALLAILLKQSVLSQDKSTL